MSSAFVTICAQDVLGLARHLLEVLCNPGVSARLQQNARATALRFSPDAIADRWLHPLCGPWLGFAVSRAFASMRAQLMPQNV